MCQGISPILASFAVLETFLLNFDKVDKWNSMSYPIGGTENLLRDWRQACPSLRTIQINNGSSDEWFYKFKRLNVI